MVNKGEFSVERRKSICVKRWRVEGRDNLVIS